jgi:hypothetical protein
MISFKIFFAEGVSPTLAKIQLLKKNPNYKQEDIDKIIQLIMIADPTPNKEYFGWLLNQFTNDKIRLPEDSIGLKNDLSKYTELKKSKLKFISPEIKEKLKLANPNDINTLSRSQLYELLGEFETTTSKRSEIQSEKMDGAEKVFQNPTWMIIKITRSKAAEYYAKRTKWCVSDPDTAHEYLQQGPLFMVYKNKQVYALVHEMSKQIMDPLDEPIKDAPDDLMQALKISGIEDTFFIKAARVEKQIKSMFAAANQKYKHFKLKVLIQHETDHSYGTLDLESFMDLNFTNLKFDEPTPLSLQKEMIKILGKPENGTHIKFTKSGDFCRFHIFADFNFDDESITRAEKFLEDIEYWNDNYEDIKNQVAEDLINNNLAEPR